MSTGQTTTNTVNVIPKDLLDRYDVFGLDPKRSCTITATVTTTTGKTIRIVWNEAIQTLDNDIFDFQLFLDYVTDRTHLYVTDLVLYVSEQNTHLIRGNIQYTGTESRGVDVTDLTVNAKNAIGLYSFEFASLNAHTHDVVLANLSHSTAVPDEYVPLLNASQQETELKTFVYKYPFEEVPWSVRSQPSAHERFDKISNKTLAGRNANQALYAFSNSKISEDLVLWFASLDPDVVAVIREDNEYKLYDQTVGVTDMTVDPNTTLFTRSNDIESESDTRWVLDYEVDWATVTGSVSCDAVIDMHANVSAYVIDRGNVATYVNPVYSPPFDVPLVELTGSESFVSRIHRFRYDQHALFSGTDEYYLANPVDTYPILLNGDLTLFQFEYSENEETTTCTLHHGSDHSVFLLTDETNQSSMNSNLWHNMNIKNDGANVAYVNLEGDRVGTMIMRQYIGASVDLTLPPKSVLFVTPTMYAIDTEGMSASQKRYVTFSYEGNVYNVVQYQTPKSLTYQFNDALDQTDIRPSSLVGLTGLSVLQTSPFKEPDSEPFGVVFDLTNDADLLADDLLIVPSDPGRYSFVAGGTPYTIARPPRTPFFADFVFGDGTSVSGLTVRPDGSQTVFANVVYETPTDIFPFFADFVFGDDTSVSGLTVRPDGSHTVLVHNDLYVKPPVDPFFTDFVFGDSGEPGLVVTPADTHIILSANVYAEPVAVVSYTADYTFDDGTILTVHPVAGSHIVFANVYAEPLDPPTYSVSYTMTQSSVTSSDEFVFTTTEYAFVSEVYVFAT